MIKYTEKEMKDILTNKNLIFVKYEKYYVFYECKNHPNILFKVRYDHIESMKGCPKCSNKNKTLIEEKNNTNISKNITILGEYNGWNVKTKCKCNICNKILYIDWNHLYRGQGCKDCGRKMSNTKRTKTQDEFEKELFKVQSSLKVIGKYVNSRSKIECECNICGTKFTGIAVNLLNLDCGCPKCRSSIGEYYIAEYLESRNIKYIRQKQFDECLYKNKLRFDFYLPEYNICIEFQGEQHYKPVSFKNETKDDSIDNFIELIFRDNIKRNFCKKHNIKLIEISYKDRDYNKIATILDNII